MGPRLRKGDGKLIFESPKLVVLAQARIHRSGETNKG
jgi:hypothetical protein